MNKAFQNGMVQLPLSEKPVIRQAGTGIHGLKPEERFFRPKLWAIHLYFWEGSVSFGGQTFQIRPHCLGITPPNLRLVWRFPLKRCPHYFIHFETPGRDEACGCLAMRSLEAEFPGVNARIERILEIWEDQRCRAEVSLWDLLWDQATAASASSERDLKALPGPMETALGIIDNEFGTALNADTLAQRIGISYSHLNRLFHQHLNTSVADFLVRKRLDHARHLLIHSNLPISAIAQMVGIPDLQHFNKFVRRHCGLSPRKLRDRGVVVLAAKAS